MPTPLPAGLELRPITPDEFDAFYRATETAFGSEPRDGDRDMERASFEFERSLAVIDGGRPVAGAGAYTFDMTLPGAVAPVAGVTWVSVLPTHRRRGLLTAMMTTQLAQLHETGEGVAALFASEPSIYGRFGYGLAAQHLHITVPRIRRAFVPEAPGGDLTRLRLTDIADARPWLEAVYDVVRLRQIGHVSRNPGRWQARLHDPSHWREGGTPLWCVVHDGDDGVDGYALYRTNAKWGPVPTGEVEVREVAATNPAAYADLWRYLLDLDLMATTKMNAVGIDDPLMHLLVDTRAVAARYSDNVYVRVVDIWRALAQRRYAEEVDVVLAVDDPVCPWNTGSWRLAAGPGGATCARTTDPADLTLPPTALGSTYLGGVPLDAIAAAGRVTEHTRGAVAALTRALRATPAPYCREVF